MPTKSFKTQLSPTSEQKETLAWWGEVRNGVFNWGRSVRRAAWERQGKSLTHYDLDGLATDKKKSDGFSHWGDPPRRVLYYALRDVDSAFQHFFRRVENGKTPGYPTRANPRGRRFTVYGDDVDIREGAIRIPKMGWVSLEESGYIPSAADVEKLSEVTVSRQPDGTWEVSVQAHVEAPIDPGRLCSESERPEAIAVHPGVRVWMALRSKGGHEERWSLPMDRLFELESRIDREHKSLSRRQPGSRGYEDQRQSLAVTYRKKRDLLDDTIHKATARLCYDIRPQRLILQPWRVDRMMEQDISDLPRKVQRRINRRMAAAQFGKIRRQIEYKAEWAGVDLVEVEDDVPVSQRCAACGYVNGDLGGSKHLDCSGCGRSVERETNALDNYFQRYEPDKVAQG